MSTDKRIRGRKLQAIRRRHFAHEPLCVMCMAEGKIKAAEELDHIVSLANDGEDTADNRQGLCKAHHRDKTAQDLGYTPRIAIGVDGEPIGKRG